MTITGELSTMLSVLGLQQGDGAALEAMVLVDLPTETSRYEEDGTTVLYLTARDAGTEFLFEDRVLTSVFIRTQPDADYGAYPRPNALVDGLSGTATRDEVLGVFGVPEWTSSAADRFVVGERFVHFQYDKSGRVSLITLMASAP